MDVETYHKISAKCDAVARKHADRQNHQSPLLLRVSHLLADAPTDAAPDATYPVPISLMRNVRKELAGLPNDVEEIVNALLNARTALDTILRDGHTPEKENV